MARKKVTDGEGLSTSLGTNGDGVALSPGELGDGEGEGQDALALPLRGKKKRSGQRSEWTKERADKFIEVLAETCNVRLAAQAVRGSSRHAYFLRTKDASFRAAWDQALAMGYSRLEMMMLERALHGVEKVIVLKSGESKTMREYDNKMALSLLRQHRDTVAAIEDRIDEDQYQEACERIIEKLARLRERELGPVETKGIPDRLKLIALALHTHCRGAA